jgi:hypothetical protein
LIALPDRITLPEHGVVFTATPAASPLEHDASREAANAMRGFSYQILTSIREWIQLADDQALFLEGAEDLDIVEEDDATTIQVRDTSRSGNITLRTSGVVDAIGHYWDHRSRNRGRRVSFRYLTTSRVGQESGAQFGRDRKGIEVWQQLKTDPDEPSRTQSAAQLKNFLLAEARLPPALLEFLRTATDAQVIEDLVVPIEWVTAAPSSFDLIQSIKNELILHGEGKGINAITSENVLGALHAEAWSVATKQNDRALDRAGFLRLFDQHTRVPVPLETLLAMVAGAISHQPVAIERTIVVADPPPSPFATIPGALCWTRLQRPPITLSLLCAEPPEPAKRRLPPHIVRVATLIGVGSTCVGVTRRSPRPGYRSPNRRRNDRHSHFHLSSMT